MKDYDKGYDFRFGFEIEHRYDEENDQDLTLVAGIVTYPPAQPEQQTYQTFLRRVSAIESKNPDDLTLRNAKRAVVEQILEDLICSATGLGNVVQMIEQEIMPSLKSNIWSPGNGES